MACFDELMGGLEGQLGGMGTAFGSSLLGLSGSLVVGLLELFASHAQNRFYRELEEWLSSITKLGITGVDPEEALTAANVMMVIGQTAEQIDQLREVVEQGVAALRRDRGAHRRARRDPRRAEAGAGRQRPARTHRRRPGAHGAAPRGAAPRAGARRRPVRGALRAA